MPAECGLNGLSFTPPEFAEACIWHDNMYGQLEAGVSPLTRDEVDQEFYAKMVIGAYHAKTKIRGMFLHELAKVYYDIVCLVGGVVIEVTKITTTVFGSDDSPTSPNTATTIATTETTEVTITKTET